MTTHVKPSGGIVEPHCGITLPAMPTQPHPERSASRLDDRSFRLVLEAEIFVDPDDGSDALIVTTDELACEPVSPARLRRMVADARAKLDAIERLAAVYEAEDTIRAIVAEHHIDLREYDTPSFAVLPPELREEFVAYGAIGSDGRLIVIVPGGQNPVQRANAIADIVNAIAAEGEK